MARPGSGLLVPINGLGYPPQNLARVVVWEWLNEHGRWRPYTAAVCHHIENVLKGDARGTVVLGQVDGQLSPYIIDLQSMHQINLSQHWLTNSSPDTRCLLSLLFPPPLHTQFLSPNMGKPLPGHSHRSQLPWGLAPRLW
ncbi:hypothetical protein FQN60_018269 [Etheostoma spectabile]|uniref:WWE domain-containing protein n=1 Tax=Etheostoma spectabile TaxID=54343 RepID=A0A5J5DHG8_9PERO|nr:hypothetical protein FQN60_018269 [Etheostoma spectabile]